VAQQGWAQFVVVRLCATSFPPDSDSDLDLDSDSALALAQMKN
jgi:hypothetical protein